jgi:hypothetical protein
VLVHLFALFRATSEVITDAFTLRARLMRRYGTTD